MPASDAEQHAAARIGSRIGPPIATAAVISGTASVSALLVNSKKISTPADHRHEHQQRQNEAGHPETPIGPPPISVDRS